MDDLNAIFDAGPAAVSQWLAGVKPGFDELDAKQLADSCWTRASTLSKTDRAGAREWGKAALSVYEFLARRCQPVVAESAHENAEALRQWKLLGDEVSAA